MPKNQHKSAKKPSFPLKKIQKTSFVLGIDEAGRGAWAGPVVAACVGWTGKNPIKNILRDSKKMTAKDRKKTHEEIQKLAQKGGLICGIGVIESAVIDALGIKEANRLAMSEALTKIQNTKPKEQCEMILLVDGRDNYVFDIPDVPEPEYIVRGDSKIKQIMAASIMAKVTRDRIMVAYEGKFPYGFPSHKGYGTALHQRNLKKIGISEIHRKSYKPVKLLDS